MSAPLRVAVVRPYQGPKWALTRFITGSALLLLNGLIVMVIVGAITPWHPGYWQTVLGLIALNIIQTSSGWWNWTWPGKRNEAAS